MTRRHGNWLASALATVLLLGACTGYEKPKPKPLEVFTPKPVASPAWTSASVRCNFR